MGEQDVREIMEDVRPFGDDGDFGDSLDFVFSETSGGSVLSDVRPYSSIIPELIEGSGDLLSGIRVLASDWESDDEAEEPPIARYRAGAAERPLSLASFVEEAAVHDISTMIGVAGSDFEAAIGGLAEGKITEDDFEAAIGGLADEGIAEDDFEAAIGGLADGEDAENVFESAIGELADGEDAENVFESAIGALADGKLAEKQTFKKCIINKESRGTYG